MQSEALSIVHRQQAYAQSQLQALLDAQSEGLLPDLRGTGQQYEDDVSSVGSKTPTSMSFGSSQIPRGRHIIPVRQPTTRKMSLQGARRGISRTIKSLVNLQDEELQIIKEAALERDECLSTILDFGEKEQGLSRSIHKIHDEEASQDLERMKAEERTLAQEIHEMENKLYEMKASHRLLKAHMEERENRVQAKLSSYQNAVESTRRETREFLNRPPLASKPLKSKLGAHNTTFWALPKDRRTLDLAKEHYSSEKQLLEENAQRVTNEKEALEDGGEVWQEVLSEVHAVEAILKSAMGGMGQVDSSPIHDEDQARADSMRAVLHTMESARRNVRSRLDLAEAQDWKLLVCCIGAEMEALDEGYEVLRGASGSKDDAEVVPWMSDQNRAHATASPTMTDSQISSGTPPYTDDHDSIRHRSSSDEGPGLDLLVSQAESQE